MPDDSERSHALFEACFLEAETPEERIEHTRHEAVTGYRVKTIRAGNMLECEIYPLWKGGQGARAQKIKPSREAQANLNHRNARKRIMRLTNANFTEKDLWATFGYDDANVPEDPKAAQRDIINYLRRVKRWRKRAGLPPLRYLYVTEWSENAKRIHHHVILSGDMDRDALEQMWQGGAYPQTRRLRVKEDCGLNGLACYLAKGRSGRGAGEAGEGGGKKLWGYSTNLKQPTVTVADHKLTKRKAERIIADENAVPEIFERFYRGYGFGKVEIKRSAFVAGVYIYVMMHKREGRGRVR